MSREFWRIMVGRIPARLVFGIINPFAKIYDAKHQNKGLQPLVLSGFVEIAEMRNKTFAKKR